MNKSKRGVITRERERERGRDKERKRSETAREREIQGKYKKERKYMTERLGRTKQK